MEFGKLSSMVLVLFIWILQISVGPVTSSLSYENKDFVKIKQDPTRYLQASAYINRERYIHRRTNITTSTADNNIETKASIARKLPRNVGRDFNELNANTTVTRSGSYKKWQVGRVSRKQYEIINMLWRKTKIFVNVDQSTSNYYPKRDNDTKRQPLKRSPMRFISTTPSFIEFYYLDEMDDHGKESMKQKYTSSPDVTRNQLRSLGNFKFILGVSPVLSFRVDGSEHKHSVIPTRYIHPTNKMRRRQTPFDSPLINFESLNSVTPQYKFPRLDNNYNHFFSSTTDKIKPVNNILDIFNNVFWNRDSTVPSISISEHAFDNQTCPMTTDPIIFMNSDANESENSSLNVNNKGSTPTIPSDRIKFFEIYDKHTPIAYYGEKSKSLALDNVEKNLNAEGKILLEHVDQSIGNQQSNPHKTKHFKKHIVENYEGDIKGQDNENSVLRKLIKNVPVNGSMAKLLNITKLYITKPTQPESGGNVIKTHIEGISRIAKWSEYPFTAAYIYEPTQVHCDAAGISPHWLVTSGSCLSRHHKNPDGNGRSAFVTYCGESWWNPERVAYVKMSLVHPRFHTRDKTRRHNYNIGLIQVVTSMASACSGWAPITLMSHQFVANAEGSTANAVGWGLDRFDTRYSSNDLPKSPLMSYENQIFSDSCPGNIGYSKAKRLAEEGGVKNVYCLSLPPYSGEDNDPVHGGLLLVGGKLVALYLQEERRPWGDQSAQYTGTWRLVPWVHDVARENEEADSFTLEM